MNRVIARSASYKWWAFGAVGLGMFTMVQDQAGLGIALPQMASHFGTDLPTVQWVLLGYVLAISLVLMPAGRLSDIIGRKRIYLIGAFVFAVGAVLAGVSPALVPVILFKTLQGVGNGMMTANGMAIIVAIFPGRERGLGMGLMSAAVGLGSVAGPLVGGFLVSLLGWRAVFYFSALLGAALIPAVALVLEEGRIGGRSEDSRRPSFDWVGAGLSTAGLVLLLLALTSGQRLGFLSPPILGALVGFFVLLAAFVAWELKAPAPMLDLALFRRRVFSLGVIARTLSMLGTSAPYLLMPFYLQGVLAYPARKAGLVMVSAALGTALAGPISGRLSDRFGWRPFALLGLTLVLAGLFILASLTEMTYTGLAIAGLALQGLGMGVFISPNLSSILGAVEREKHGVVTAFLNLNRTAANLAGVAVGTAVVAMAMLSAGYEPRLELTGGGLEAGRAFTRGMRLAYLAMAVCVLGALVASLWGLRLSRKGPALSRGKDS